MKQELIFENIHHKKIDDEKAYELYRNGLSDKQIAKVFGCSRTQINRWRHKRQLIANYVNPFGKTLNEEECIESDKRIIKSNIEHHQRKYHEDKKYHNIELEKRKKNTKLWLKKNLEKKKKYDKENYLKHRDARLKKSKEYQKNNLDKFREYNHKAYQKKKIKKEIES